MHAHTYIHQLREPAFMLMYMRDVTVVEMIIAWLRETLDSKLTFVARS